MTLPRRLLGSRAGQKTDYSQSLYRQQYYLLQQQQQPASTTNLSTRQHFISSSSGSSANYLRQKYSTKRRPIFWIKCWLMTVFAIFVGVTVGYLLSSSSRATTAGPDANDNKNNINNINDNNPFWNAFAAPVLPLQPSLPEQRAQRFPSVEDRVRIYMSYWYAPPCNDSYIAYYHYNSNNNHDAPNEESATTTADSLSDKTTTVTLTKKATTLKALQHNKTDHTVTLHSDPENGQVFFAKQSDFFPPLLPENSHNPDASSMFHHLRFNDNDDNKDNYCKQRFPKNARLRNECRALQATVPRSFLFQDYHQDTSSSSSWPQQRQRQRLPPLLWRMTDGTGGLYHFPKFHIAREALTRAELNRLTGGNIQQVGLSNLYDSTTTSHTQQQRQQQHQQLNQVAVGSPSCSHNGGRVGPIIWNTNQARHMEPLQYVATADVLWHEKKDAAVFRGALSGPRIVETIADVDSAQRDQYSRVTNCFRFPRCRLAYEATARNSSIIDAKLTQMARGFPTGIVADDKDESKVNVLTHEKMTMSQLLQYKALIFVDGNDVPSGLNWGLLSRSVIVLPHPIRFTTWVMEEFLQPYVHYVPIYDLSNFSHVQEQVQWILQNDQKAQEIAHRGSLWMEDLVLHPNASRDNELVYHEILKRYMTHFQPRSTTMGAMS